MARVRLGAGAGIGAPARDGAVGFGAGGFTTTPGHGLSAQSTLTLIVLLNINTAFDRHLGGINRCRNRRYGKDRLRHVSATPPHNLFTSPLSHFSTSPPLHLPNPPDPKKSMVLCPRATVISPSQPSRINRQGKVHLPWKCVDTSLEALWEAEYVIKIGNDHSHAFNRHTLPPLHLPSLPRGGVPLSSISGFQGASLACGSTHNDLGPQGSSDE
ncbi:hypothetical protein BDK51DRAFT_49829 [Blyttiomyces helicus]|uniref:Uncharacterized protein n=1 Tax=Blyttiomyces helicus TaxID=388810 RepID=A0A4P9VX55_9FUNG|nr:hypothetical protein BDK51DRAFT_49829 [Blyttiomyces helicus]|eukprot:RKO82858.1 hypothetical protein BDK51DRAFT_49829 [Blyttiomyces helicus]